MKEVTIEEISRMQIRVPRSAIFRRDISHGAKVCYVLFEAHAQRRRKTEARLSVALIAEQLRKSPAAIKRYTRELQDAGLIKKVRCPGQSLLYILVKQEEK